MNLPSLMEFFSKFFSLSDDEKKKIREIVENFYLRNSLFLINLTEEYKIAKDIYRIEKHLKQHNSIQKTKIKSKMISNEETYSQYKSDENLSDEAIERIMEKIVRKFALYKTSILLIKSLNVNRSIILLCWFIGLMSTIFGIFLKSVLLK